MALVRWMRRVDSVTPLGGGWNSRTWLVAADDERYVAKLVDHLDAQGLDAGLRLAAGMSLLLALDDVNLLCRSRLCLDQVWQKRGNQRTRDRARAKMRSIAHPATNPVDNRKKRR